MNAELRKLLSARRVLKRKLRALEDRARAGAITHTQFHVASVNITKMLDKNYALILVILRGGRATRASEVSHASGKGT